MIVVILSIVVRVVHDFLILKKEKELRGGCFAGRFQNCLTGCIVSFTCQVQIS